MRCDSNIIDAAEDLQQKIAEQTELMTAFNIGAVNIEVKGLK
jgi:uncharacterized alkaline shock family protein YloU